MLGMWPFPTLNAFRQVQGLDRGTSKVWQGEGGKVTKWGFTDVLSHMTWMSVRVTLGCGWIVLFLLASTGLADTTDYTGRGQEQQG